jgi:parallel beta-helix repeat protein
VFVPDNFSTIQDAIINASEGDVILVRPGVYYERLYIYENITLIGSDEETTIINGTWEYDVDALDYVEETAVVSIYASGAKIMRFTISDGDIGVLVTPGGEYEYTISDVGVYEILFKNIAHEAIHAENCVNCVFQGNSAESETGISSTGGESNAIEGNKLTGNDVAIDVAGSHDKIRQNSISGGVIGIRLVNGTDDLIQSNMIANMTGNSIEVIGSQRAIIDDNQISGGLIGTCGIMLEDSTGGNLNNNLVEGMNGAGIFLMRSRGNILEGTETLGNLVGILLAMSNGNSIRGSRASGDSNGLILNHSDGNTIFNSIFRDSETGIMLDHSNANSLLFLLFLKNHAGLMLDSSNGLIFDTNFLQGNAFGLLSHGSSSGRIRHSLFFVNEVAIQLEGSGGFIIDDNMFAHGGTGVALLHSSGRHQIFHNLFITATTPAVGDGISRWDNGAEGNFWSAYSGRDENGDGIGDTPFLGLDRYPLMTIGYVESKPMKDIIQDLRYEIAALNLGKGTTNSLFAKIDAAEKSYYKNGNVGAAQNQLQALINEINALKLSRRMSSAMAETLIAKIKAIMALMLKSDSDFDDLSYEQERMLGTSPSSIDTDGDGMPDGWEVANGLNPLSARDAQSDLDGDGVSNLNEYLVYERMAEFSGSSTKITIQSIFGVNSELVQQVEHFVNKSLKTSGGQGVKALDFYTPVYVIATYITQFHSVVQLMDSDHDGLSDSYEIGIGTNPNNWDTDGDHMSDGWEVEYGLNPNMKVGGWWGGMVFYYHMYGDPDGDSIGNRYEYWLNQMFASSSVNYMEMDPYHKDLVVEVDWVPSFEPDWTRLDVVKTPFSNHAIALHIIRGAELDSKYAVFSGTDPNDFYQERANVLHSDSRLDTTRSWQGLVRFAISVDNLGDGAGGSSGNAYAIPNDMFAFAHCGDSGWVATCTSHSGIATTPECAVAGTFMHELGHTLGLHHGGDVDTNNKLYYDSIMNYRYQIVGTDVTGDQKGDGGTRPATEVVNYSDGSNGTGDFNDWNHVISHLGDGITHNGP